jgi:hypothetical protein
MPKISMIAFENYPLFGGYFVKSFRTFNILNREELEYSSNLFKQFLLMK